MTELALQALRISAPYVLAALGGVFAERGGVVNIALEGMMLAGAFGYVLAAFAAGSPALGVVAGVLGGALLAALLAWVVLRLGTDAVVAGVALNLLALGGTRFGLKLAWGSASNSARVESPTALLAGDGTIGAVLALLSHPLFLATVVSVAAAHVLLFRTRFGLRLRACGEHGEAARAAGVRVGAVRTAGVLLSGALAGLGGVWLAADAHQFTDGMTGGRGYIALAAMILGRRRPVAAATACLLFGAAETAQVDLQGRGLGLPTQVLQMLPYVLTLLALVVARRRVGRSVAPGGAGE